MIEARDKVIDDKLWTVTMLPAGVGMEVGSKILALVGPALGKAVSSTGGGSILDSESLPGIGDAIGELSRSLGNPEAVALVRRLVTTGVHCDSVEVTSKNFDLLFAGSYLTLLKVAAFAIEVNFGIPFDSLAGVVRRSVAGAVRMSRPPASSEPTPAGTSKPAPSSGAR